ncbi:MAG: hypothetical protein IAE92_02490 [Burkholderiaceae bacterium]|nr:hypothetical protein [Burkholderiaceae bacterium]
MTITASDIKLLESERMRDTSDGGGRRTSRVIPDGVPGNIFPKVSRLDSVYGRVNLRKIYGAVVTVNLDVYAGAHAIISDAPDNDKIHAALFSTGSEFDDRTAARDRIESYVIAGPESRMVIYGRQLVGQGAVLVYQSTDEPLPEVGDVFCLSKEAAGVTAYQQYVRVTDISHEVRTLVDDRGEFRARVVTLRIGSTLRYEFSGPSVPSRFSNVARESLVRLTTVADASRYFGIQPLTLDAETGALSVQVASVYTQIVPTTNRETPLSNITMVGASSRVPIATEPIGPVTLAKTVLPYPAGITLRLPKLPKPGTVVVKVPGRTNVGVFTVFSDLGNGTSSRTSEVQWGYLEPGDAMPTSMTIDYEAGTVFISMAGAEFGALSNAAVRNIVLTYLPAVDVSRPAHTMNIPVTLATRGTVYAQTLLPIPYPGSLSLSYRALGKWYTLRDNGAGELSGSDAAYGTGSVDNVTGALVVTLGALPDAGSSVIITWGSSVHVTQRNKAFIEPPVFRHALPDTGIEPGTVSISWDVNYRDVNGNVTSTVEQSLTDDGDGNLTGDGIGRIVYSTGSLWFLPSKLPDPGSTPVIDYEKSAMVEDAFSPSADGAGMISVTLTDGPAVPGSVTVLWQTTRDKTVEEKTGASSNNVAYLVTPVADPATPTVGGAGVTPVSPAPEAPIYEGTLPGTSYPLIGATLNNSLGLPVKFQPYSGASPYSAAYHVNAATGQFIVHIPESVTTWGGVPIAAADRLPTIPGNTAPATTYTYAATGMTLQPGGYYAGVASGG